MTQDGRLEAPEATAVYTGADALTDALLAVGVEYLFVNLGTDHPALVESWARRTAEGRPLPRIVTSPHETVALAAAMGYADVSGRMQAVLVHVDVGTQNLGGMVHNAARGRVPVLILAGASSVTLHGEMKGSRTDFIQFVQDVYDQRGIVREYMKWSYEVKTGKVLPMLVFRATQMARSDPAGPVYLVAAREMLEEPVSPDWPREVWAEPGETALPPAAVRRVVEAIAASERPVIITAYAGRRPEAVERLVALSERLAVPVVESSRRFLNFPDTHPHHVGHEAPRLVQEADLIVILDADVPWVPLDATPRPGTRVFHLDLDPIKAGIPLWHLPIEAAWRVSAPVALEQCLAYLDAGFAQDPAKLAARRRWIQRQRAAWEAGSPAHPDPGAPGAISPEYVSQVLNTLIGPEALVINETCSRAAGAVNRYLPRTRAGTLFSSGASSLGWGGGAALGAKLAAPERLVVHLTGDGAFMFSVPTAVYWMARRYQAPFLTVVFDNANWDAARRATIRQHPDGFGARTGCFFTDFENPPAYHEIARAAGGAFGVRVERPEAVADALAQAIAAVREGSPAVVNIAVAP
ncbi:MAG: thiamine pyrophosphate-requiring protein [Firmicutes bacterium]|nr:thiamine pyrophosphate-requiring protein [Alicyclobacillaceae bacterium]MCL6496609.1 thiamine pyrophosphate-requiring protein [Bacillota bacterium]